MKAKLGKIWTDSVAYVMLLAGAGLSILFNVVNTLDRRGDLIDWVDWVIAIAAPAFVVGMVEMFVNARWIGQPWYMQMLRWAGTLVIGGVAMRVSWTHGHELLLSRGQTADVAALFPLSIDLLAIMATGLILSGRVQAIASQVSKRDHSLRSIFSDGQDTALDILADEDQATLDTWRTEVTQDIPAPLDIRMDNSEATWTPAGEVPPLGVSIPDALPSWLDGLADRAGGGPSTPAHRGTPYITGPAMLPLRNPASTRLSPVQRAEIRELTAAGRQYGMYSVGEIRELLAAWYEVSTKTIQRVESAS